MKYGHNFVNFKSISCVLDSTSASRFNSSTNHSKSELASAVKGEGRDGRVKEIRAMNQGRLQTD